MVGALFGLLVGGIIHGTVDDVGADVTYAITIPTFFFIGGFIGLIISFCVFQFCIYKKKTKRGNLHML